MFYIIVGIILLILIYYLFIHKKESFTVNSRFAIFPEVLDDDGILSRPNCPQLNSPDVCSNTLGCKQSTIGCINDYRSMKEQDKEWNKNDWLSN
jgi:hypothetical protein